MLYLVSAGFRPDNTGVRVMTGGWDLQRRHVVKKVGRSGIAFNTGLKVTACHQGAVTCPALSMRQITLLIG